VSCSAECANVRSLGVAGFGRVGGNERQESAQSTADATMPATADAITISRSIVDVLGCENRKPGCMGRARLEAVAAGFSGAAGASFDLGAYIPQAPAGIVYFGGGRGALELWL
jgi:hypothetical protein